MPDSHLQVGAPDPERETSPIVDYEGQEEEEEGIEPRLPAGNCKFNGVEFRLGEYVLSGSELLRCESPGLWVREGELRTDQLRRS